ncbi:MAG: hypothetical protein ACK2U9_14620 [Anaerolineae bacterium]
MIIWGGTYYNHYTPEQAIGLYPTDGTTDDFAYGDLGVAAYTFELGTSFFQSCPVFENTILPDNMPALIYAAKVVRTPYLTPSGPDSLGVTATPATVTLGDPSTLTATVDDTRFNNSSGTEPTQNIMAAEYYVDVPPWDTGNNPQPHPMAPADGSFNSPVEAVTGQVDTATLTPGRHLLFVRGQDADGNWGAFSAAFLDVQLPPAPDFTLHATPSSQTICAPADAVYDVAVGSLRGYNDPVTLSAGNTPPGTSVAFSTNPVTPPASSQLTVGNTGSGTAGSYAIDVVGVGSSGVHTSTVGLDLYTAALQNPPNGAINVPADVTIFWDPAAQASKYTIEIATDSGFTNIVDSATVAGTSYTSVALITSTPYYWHVTADNLCGANTSSTFSFVTISGPVVYCSQPGLAIPDNNGTGVTDTLVVPANLDIADLNVVLRATHTWVGDLRFSLQHVDTGTSAVFYDRPGVPASTFGCSVDNVDATVDDQGTDGDLETTCLPTPPAIAGSLVGGDPPNASLLAAFEDEDANGSWVITAADLAGGDTGVLTEWCLEVTAACYDFNGTGRVDVADVQSVSGAWGTNNPLYDLDHNGTVNVNDIQIIANKWNTFCSVQ